MFRKNTKHQQPALISAASELHPVKIKVGLAELERVGALEHLGDDGVRMSIRKSKWDSAAIQQAALQSREHIRRGINCSCKKARWRSRIHSRRNL